MMNGKSLGFNPVNPVILSLLCLVFACKPATQKPAQREWFAMGTVARITLHQEDAPRIGEAFRIAREAVASVEACLSLFDPASPLAQINALAGEGWDVAIPLPHAVALEFALRVAAQSGGAFDPTVGPLMRLWGFRGGSIETAPDPETVARVRETQTGFRHVRVLPVFFEDLDEVRLERPGMSLDLGAVAKGFAADLALDELWRAGFAHVQINLGGDLRVMGSPSATRAEWRVGVRDPFTPGAYVETLSLWHGEAVATSGDYERFVELDGVRYAHILDGRTGWPVTNVVSCTVVAPTAMEADAVSTALFILGPAEGMVFLETHYPSADALWITAPPGSQRVASPGMSQRLGAK